MLLNHRNRSKTDVQIERGLTDEGEHVNGTWLAGSVDTALAMEQLHHQGNPTFRPTSVHALCAALRCAAQRGKHASLLVAEGRIALSNVVNAQVFVSLMKDAARTGICVTRLCCCCLARLRCTCALRSVACCSALTFAFVQPCALLPVTQTSEHGPAIITADSL